jgi:hypothetical protein
MKDIKSRIINMAAFPTPREMFQDWQSEQAYIYEKTQDRYEILMEEYQNEAVTAIRKNIVDIFSAHSYTICIANAYFNDIKEAEEIFKLNNLNILHAYALLEYTEQFTDEWDRKNGNEPDYD